MKSSPPAIVRTLAVLALLCAAAACDSPSGSGSKPAAVDVFSGNDQQGRAGQALSNPVSVRVNDATGNPVRGAQVTWSTPNGGFVAANSPTSDQAGLAYATWTLGPGSGEQRLVARVDGVADSAVFIARVSTGGTTSRLRIQPDSLVFTSLGRQQLVQAMALNASGNVTDPVAAEYTSLDPHIALLDGQWVRGVGVGRARIMATAGTDADTIIAVMRPVLDRIGADGRGLLSEAADTFAVGDVLQLYAADSSRVVVPAVFTSSASAVAEVDAGGALRIRGAGHATVSATREGSTVSVLLTAVPVANPTRSLTVGGHHTCGLASGGVVYCWGSGAAVPYPRSTPHGEPAPTRIETDVRFDVLEAGRHSTCGISLQGAGYCWGMVPYRTTESMQPISDPIADPAAFRSLSIGWGWLCGVSTAGEYRCWSQGRASLPAPGYRSVSVGPGTGTSAHSDYRCAIRENGTLSCVSSPVVFDTISAGLNFGCGLSAGTAYCWGENGSGQLGRGTTEASSVPQPVAGGRTFTSLSVGVEHACAVATNGQAWCWGANYTGQLGTGTTTAGSVPMPVQQGALRFTSIATASIRDDFGQMIGHTCAVATDDRIYCWGDNRYGQLGIGTIGGMRTVPAQVARPRY